MSQLVVPSSKRSDSGLYTIKAKNSVGEASFDIEVHVTGMDIKRGFNSDASHHILAIILQGSFVVFCVSLTVLCDIPLTDCIVFILSEKIYAEHGAI